MNPDIKEKWTAALRSGKYPQGTGHLHDIKGYCCLGVLCELAVDEGIIGKHNHGEGVDLITFYGEDESTAYLPKPVVDWAGLNSTVPRVRVPCNGGEHALDYVNDVMKKTFTEIADIIEQEL